MFLLKYPSTAVLELFLESSAFCRPVRGERPPEVPLRDVDLSH